MGLGRLPVPSCLLPLAAAKVPRMHAKDWFRFLFGQRQAIQRIASSSTAIWTGLFLVLLTAIARNYDQTLITENPLMWIFGPLLFSLVSGTWLYTIVYGGFARREMAAPDEVKPDFWAGWRSFMGLFWMTAPVAWLYAIPVERWFDSLVATKMNLVLLAVVSLWRVLLMARAMQVVTAAPYLISLVWVMFAASIEALVVFFFGGGFARAIMASMGGMRNSPEESLLYGAMNTAFVGAMWTAVITLVLGLVWRPRGLLIPLREPATSSFQWGSLATAAVVWIAVAIVPQRELANTVAAEKLLVTGQTRLALDYLSARELDQFSPGRPLPPKAFERSIFAQLPACFEVLRPDDALWVRAHLMRRLSEMTTHYGPRWRSRRGDPLRTRPEQIQDVIDGLRWHGPHPNDLVKLLDGLSRIPESKEWMRTNTVFLEGLSKATVEPAENDHDQMADWLAVSNRLSKLSVTGQISGTSNHVPVTNSLFQAK